MKTKFSTYLTWLLAALLLAVPAAAREQPETESSVEFFPGEGAVPALDPDQPGLFQETEEDLVVTGNQGPLSVDVVPHLRFGSSENPLAIFALGHEYALTAPAKPFVQVSDLRGTGQGWSLFAGAAQFVDVQSGEKSLPGAQIILRGGKAVSSNAALAEKELAPRLPSEVVLECSDRPESEALVAVSDAHCGMGAWVLRLYSLDEEPLGNGELKAVTLKIPPGGGGAGAHATVITWRLADVP